MLKCKKFILTTGVYPPVLMWMAHLSLRIIKKHFSLMNFYSYANEVSLSELSMGFKVNNNRIIDRHQPFR